MWTNNSRRGGVLVLRRVLTRQCVILVFTVNTTETRTESSFVQMWDFRLRNHERLNGNLISGLLLGWLFASFDTRRSITVCQNCTTVLPTQRSIIVSENISFDFKFRCNYNRKIQPIKTQWRNFKRFPIRCQFVCQTTTRKSQHANCSMSIQWQSFDNHKSHKICQKS